MSEQLLDSELSKLFILSKYLKKYFFNNRFGYQSLSVGKKTNSRKKEGENYGLVNERTLKLDQHGG